MREIDLRGSWGPVEWLNSKTKMIGRDGEGEKHFVFEKLKSKYYYNIEYLIRVEKMGRIWITNYGEFNNFEIYCYMCGGEGDLIAKK